MLNILCYSCSSFEKFNAKNCNYQTTDYQGCKKANSKKVMAKKVEIEDLEKLVNRYYLISCYKFVPPFLRALFQA